MRFLPLSVLACLLVSASLFAQAPARPDPFAAEADVIERLDEVFAMQPDGTGYRERTIVVRVQSDAALRSLGVLSIPFASASEHVDIHYARIRRPDGTVIETPVADAQEQPTAVTREAPFYSDQKEKQLPIRSLRVGDRLEWQVRVVRTKPEAPNQFWGETTFEQTDVLLAETVELRVPRATTVNVWTKPGLPKPVETTTATEHIYHWDYANLKPTVGAAAEAARKQKAKTRLTPEEEIDGREGAFPSIQWSTFASWAAVGDWYRSVEGDRNKPDAEIKAKVAELTKGTSNIEDKVRAVYNFVATQLRYIGVSFGVGRFQPHQASEVLQNQYGDCKDKHTLLAAMLTELGLHPDAVLIGSGIRFNPAVPSPAAFNHLITRVDVEGKPVWLDTTAEVAPYRMLLFNLRDRQALIVPDSGTPSLARTPADPPFPSLQSMKAVGVLDDKGVSNSRITLTLRGDAEVFYRAILRQVPPASYGEFVQKLSEGLGYGGTATNPEFSRADDTRDPVTLSYDYKREQGGDWDHHKIIPQLPYRSLPTIDKKEPPIQSIDLGLPRTETGTSEMKLPQGWGAELPEARHAKSDFATFDETYRFDHGTVYADQKIVILKRYIPAADWKTYQQFIDSAGLDDQTYIQLTHTDKTADRGDKRTVGPVRIFPPASSPAHNDPEAAKLIQEAFDKMNTDPAAVLPLLQQAEALNPAQKDLWGAYAALDYSHRAWPQAVSHYVKELALHPDSYWVYAPLSRTFAFTDHPKEALVTLRSWASAEPSNPDATIALVEALIADNDANGAVTAAKEGIAALPEDKRALPAVQLALGNALMKAGKKAEGEKTLTALLPTNDPLTLNDAAYALADAKLALPAAESAQQRALALLGAETLTWTLDESPEILKSKSSLLIAAWDTMGWIYFREDKFDQAAAYLEPSWNNQHSTIVGEHLGDVRAAQGNRSGAVDAYELALDAVPPEDEKVATFVEASTRIQAKIDKLKAAGAKASISEGVEDRRRITLGPAKGRSGMAGYRMLISKAKVIKVAPMEGKSIEGGDDLLLGANLSKFLPSESNAHLYRTGSLNCNNETCEITLAE